MASGLWIPCGEAEVIDQRDLSNCHGAMELSIRRISRLCDLFPEVPICAACILITVM